VTASDDGAIEPTQQPDLRGRSVLITGAGDGLGAELARAAGAAGAEVILLGRTVAKLTAVFDAIVAAGGPDPAICPLDLEGATPDDYADIAQRLGAQCGGLDGLVHNAAVLGPQTPIEHYPPLEWARTLQVNVTAPMLLTQALIPHLRAGRAPAIIFLGEQRRTAYWGAYGPSKAALAGLADILRDELETEPGIRVETVDPGPLRTSLRATAFPGELPDERPPPAAAVPRLLAALAGPAHGGGQ
jgi:NAD(P)-dependent dehydrogenase (short-subunit alcohol dehydrogenase family)